MSMLYRKLDDEAAKADLRRGRVRVFEVSRTKQAMKEECDINNIMKRYERTGIVQHVNKHAAQYGDVPAVDLLEAYAIVEKAKSMFDDLPAKARKRFGNDPMEFLAFVQNPENKAEAEALGLLHVPAKTPDTKPAEPAPTQ